MPKKFKIQTLFYIADKISKRETTNRNREKKSKTFEQCCKNFEIKGVRKVVKRDPIIWAE
jgi:hypothetical protein